MATRYIALGSNIDPGPNLEAAARALADTFTVTGVSTFYRNVAIGPDGAPSGQADFINGAMALETDASPQAIVARLRRIETALGRRRGPDAYAPRTIDLDLVVAASDAGPPHVRVPLQDLQGSVDGPPDHGGMEPLPELTRRIRRCMR